MNIDKWKDVFNDYAKEEGFYRCSCCQEWVREEDAYKPYNDDVFCPKCLHEFYPEYFNEMMR